MDKTAKKVLLAMQCMTRQCWEQGIAAQALLEIGEKEMLALFVYDMVLRQSADGRLCNVENTPAITDSAFCIPAVYALAEETQHASYLKAAEKNIAFLCEKAGHAKDGTLYHMADTTDIWADSAAFLPYVLALTGHVREGIVQMKGICQRLYDADKGLYYHMWNEERGDYTRKVCWGVGNGWILTGLLRLCLILRKSAMAEFGEFLEMFQSLLEKMLQCLDENFLLHDVLDDRDSFPESESSEMLAYAIYQSVNENLLPAGYLDMADRIRSSVRKNVTKDGLVWNASSSPAFDRPGTSVECQAHYLMMEKAYLQSRKQEKRSLHDI